MTTPTEPRSGTGRDPSGHAAGEQAPGSQRDAACLGQRVPSELCNEFRFTAARIASKQPVEASVIAACAVHTGIQLALRDFPATQVADWLEHEAQELRRQLAMLL